MTHRRTVGLLRATLLVVAAVALVTGSGCGEKSKVVPTGPVNEVIRHGDRSMRAPIEDPLVARAVASYEATEGGVEAAQIIGYLVDYVEKDYGDGGAIFEVIVMKDGTPFHSGGDRPGAAFGGRPAIRLTPEPERESVIRKAAIGKAQETVSRLRPGLERIDPLVFGYLIRITETQGATADIMVAPEGPLKGQRPFYTPRIKPLTK